MTIPVVVQMTVDSGTTYNLSADTNLQEIDLDNELEINVVSYDVPEYEGSYTVDAGLSPVVLNTQDKRLTQNVTVNALTENTLSNINLSVNSNNGEVTADVSLSPGYNEMGKGTIATLALPTQSARTITPTTSEQTAVAKGKYTTGVVKVGAIPSQYADITGVTAQASDVLAGKYFVNNLGELTLGTAIAGGGDGAPMPVDTVAEMIDTTKVYLYVGSEAGYTFGNWYYYDGNDWVSGGKWGADGGVNTNARNLLDYILERVAYTETGMQVYVDALYEALAQAGAVTTTYTITNALLHVTNSNSAGGADSGDSYSATLTADVGYAIDTVTITMGGVDITSTAYTSGTGAISIASVTGNIVITSSATNSLVPTGYTAYDYVYYKGSDTTNGGTAIIIPTPTFANLNNLIVDFDFMPKVTATTARSLIGGRTAADSNGVSLYSRTDTKRVSAYSHGTALGINDITSVAVGNVVHVHLDPHSTSPSTLTVDSTYSDTQAWTNSNTLNSAFGYCGKYYASGSSLYKFAGIGILRLYDVTNNDTLVGEYYPCVRDADNVIGVYDTVSATFYTANTTGYTTIGNASCVWEVGNWGE